MEGKGKPSGKLKESGEVRRQARPQRQKLLQTQREAGGAGGRGGGAWEDCRGVSSPGTSDTAAKKKGWGLKSKCPGSRTKGGHGKGRREGPGIN